MIFFVCCLFVRAPSMMFDSLLKKQDYLWFLGKPNYSIFEFENLFFCLFSLLLSSNLIEFIIIFYEYRLIRNCHFYWPWWERKRNHLETLEEVAWQFFCPHLWPLPPCLNLPTVNYIIAAEFVDFLHIKPKSLKKRAQKCRQFMPNPQYLFAVTT